MFTEPPRNLGYPSYAKWEFSSTGTFCVLNQKTQTIVVGPQRPPGIHLVGTSSEVRMEAPRIPPLSKWVIAEISYGVQKSFRHYLLTNTLYCQVSHSSFPLPRFNVLTPLITRVLWPI